MNSFIERFMNMVETFFIFYILAYSSYLFLSVITGAWHLYKKNRMSLLYNELKHDYYVPVSIIVPAYNEEVTIIENIESLIGIDYQLYEIIIVDDGSTDKTLEKLIKAFDFKLVNRPIHRKLKCRAHSEVYEASVGRIKLTMIVKLNGGKGDALNMGINASKFPYFLSVDADSVLQRDSLEKIVQPALEDDSIIAVGGLIRVGQCASIEDGEIKEYHIPWNPIISMQVVEYDRSFLASRILLNQFNGNLIISGAFGLFKKSVVLSCGGYDTGTLGEDMELVLKLHMFCRNNNIKYSMHYEAGAVCWSQAPSSLKDLMTQRRRWYIGLFQCMKKYRSIFANKRFGLVSFLSYMYYLLFELLSPVIEVFGIATIIFAWGIGTLNIRFMIKFLLLYGIYGAIVTITAFFQRVYTQNLKVKSLDIVKVIIICLIESIFFRYVLSFVRVTSFIGYKKKKMQWGSIERVKR